nr:ABC transporter ATP-binding protein [Zhihengliuella flava]
MAPGSVTALVGPAGSGKSTAGAVLAGHLPRDVRDSAERGTAPGLTPDADRLVADFRLGDQRVAFTGAGAPRIDVAAWSRRVAMLPQDARHYLSGVRETVREELAFTLENAGTSRAEMIRTVQCTAAELGLEHLLGKRIDRLSGGQERLVAIGALAVQRPDVLVLDEPLAGLDQRGQHAVAVMAQRLRAAGCAIVILSNAVDRMVAEVDSAMVLDEGRVAARWGALDGPGALARAASAAGVVVEADLQQPRVSARASSTTTAAQTAGSTDPALVLEGLSVRYPSASMPAVTGFDLTVDRGEAVALLGPNGAGKTSVLKTIAGLIIPERGTVRAADVGLLLQHPVDQLFERTVEREVSFGYRGRHRQRAVQAVLERLGLGDVVAEHPAELPASRQRLVALACVVLREPDVLLLDEPTVALDAHGRDALVREMYRVLLRGGAVLMSTHDSGFAATHAHRVVELGARAEHTRDGHRGMRAPERPGPA